MEAPAGDAGRAGEWPATSPFLPLCPSPPQLWHLQTYLQAPPEAAALPPQPCPRVRWGTRLPSSVLCPQPTGQLPLGHTGSHVGAVGSPCAWSRSPCLGLKGPWGLLASVPHTDPHGASTPAHRARPPLPTALLLGLTVRRPQVPEIVSVLRSKLQETWEEHVRQATQYSVSLLASQHCEAVVSSLLGSPLPFDRYRGCRPCAIHRALAQAPGLGSL